MCVSLEDVFDLSVFTIVFCLHLLAVDNLSAELFARLGELTSLTKTNPASVFCAWENLPFLAQNLLFLTSLYAKPNHLFPKSRASLFNYLRQSLYITLTGL